MLGISTKLKKAAAALMIVLSLSFSVNGIRSKKSEALIGLIGGATPVLIASAVLLGVGTAGAVFAYFADTPDQSKLPRDNGGKPKGSGWQLVSAVVGAVSLLTFVVGLIVLPVGEGSALAYDGQLQPIDAALADDLGLSFSQRSKYAAELPELSQAFAQLGEYAMQNARTPEQLEELLMEGWQSLRVELDPEVVEVVEALRAHNLKKAPASLKRLDAPRR